MHFVYRLGKGELRGLSPITCIEGSKKKPLREEVKGQLISQEILVNESSSFLSSIVKQKNLQLVGIYQRLQNTNPYFFLVK